MAAGLELRGWTNVADIPGLSEGPFKIPFALSVFNIF
jgi:hypothetical protein